VSVMRWLAVALLDMSSSLRLILYAARYKLK